MSQSRAGEWTVWRVGRHHLAWRPVRKAALHKYRTLDAQNDEGAELLSWLAALLATIVVLPWRLATNRWPVVAYVVSPLNIESRRRRTPPMPRAKADEVARRWADHIGRYGEPPES